MRVLVSNPNGLTGPLRSMKMERIQQKALAYEVDILCLTEQNQNLRRIPIQHQLNYLTQGWWEHRRVSQSYNKHYDSGKEQQIGGVSIIATNTIAHRSTSVNHDPTGLGRWTSMLIQGKRGFSTRIVCVYRPCKSSGPDTAYIQQVLYFNKIQCKGDPRQLLMDDLATSISEWKQKGEKNILVGDFNTGDKNTPRKLSQFWNPWLKRTGLINAHQQFTDNIHLPSTHERGQVQIDYIFVSPGIAIHRAGFLPFAKFPRDHRAIWMDISMTDVIGYKPPQLSMANARQLTMQDPRVVKRYLETLKTKLQENNILTKINELNLISLTDWSEKNTEEYQQLSFSFRSAMIYAERTCRKFKTGIHPWSPTLDKARRMKFYWELKVKHLLGLHIPMRKIIKLQKRLKIHTHNVTLDTTRNNQSLARKEYNRIKRNSIKYRISFREDLASAIANHKQISHSSALRELINREEIRNMHRRIKWMRCKHKGLSTSGVLITKSNGTKTLVSDKETLEDVIIAENERKFHQT